MDQILDEVHIDLDVLCLMSLYIISAKLHCTLIVTPNDGRLMKPNTQLSEEILKTNSMNGSIDETSIFSLHKW